MKELSEAGMAQMLAYEAFIRRASRLNLPFMLKGSYVTRQYFPDPQDRIPNDLDWVYLENLRDEEDARRTFNDWLIKITECDENDGVRFQSFREDASWGMMEYAMAEDFPTVNTHLRYWVDGKAYHMFTLDITFNLDLEALPIPLYYQPLRGEPFIIPKTVPLSLQVAWKVHQTLVRPRFKDIFDLTQLLQHPTFDAQVLAQALQTLVNECSADNVDVRTLLTLIDGNLQLLIKDEDIRALWEFWRFGKSKKLRFDTYPKAAEITDAKKLPATLIEFLESFQFALQKAGFIQEVVNQLPAPTRQKRKGYDTPTPTMNAERPAFQEGAAPPIENHFIKKPNTFMNFLSRLFK